MTTIYVSPDGSDSNSGTKSSPFGSLEHAISEVNGMSDSAGTTIRIRGGSYSVNSSSKIRLQASGTVDAPVRIEAYEDEEPVFDVSSVSNGTHDGAFRLDSVEHVELSGLEFHSSSGFGVTVVGACRDVSVEHCTFHHNANTGLYFYLNSGDASDILVRNCESYANVSGNSHADGFAVGQDDAGGSVTLEQCEAHHNEDDGFDFYFGSGEEIWHSVSWSNGFDEDGNQIYGSGGGNGFKMGGGSNSGANHLYKSVAYQNGSYGVMDNKNPGNCKFYNLTLWDNGSDNINCWGDGNHEIRNCISYQGGVKFDSHHDDQSNTWNQGIDDPQFKSTDPSNDTFLKIGSDSPCVDAGVDVGLDYAGDAPDLGAHERDTGSTDGGASAALYYHDGSDWQPVALKYNDGEQFV